MAALSSFFLPQFTMVLSGAVVPNAAGKVFTYAAGTNTLKTTYKDTSGSVAHTNPIVLDADGFPPGGEIYFGTGAYDVAVQDSAGVPLRTFSSINAAETAGASDAVLDSLALSTGASLIGFKSGTVADALSESISVYQYGASIANTASQNVVAFSNAITAAAAAGRSLYIPSNTGPLLINDEITIPAGMSVFGDGFGALVQQTEAGKNIFIVGNDCRIEGVHFKFAVAGNNLDFTKQNAVFSSGARNVSVRNCVIELNSICSGVHFRDVQNAHIAGNLIYGGLWDGTTAGPAASASDVLFYSLSTGGGRSVIESNFCLSNNSQGIFFNANGLDNDSTINGNICVTLDSSTWGYAASGGFRRHGIVVSYGGSNQTRATVSNNVIRNTTWTGIYIQGAGSANGGQVTVTGNTISRTGYASGNALSANIYVTSNGGELVTANNCVDYQGDTGASIKITCPAAGGVAGTTVTGNNITTSANIGISIENKARDVVVRANTITGSEKSDVVVSLTSGDAALGGIVIDGNTCIRSNIAAASIRHNQASGLLRSQITGNKVRGTDSSTASANNIAISISGANPLVSVVGNFIENWYYGINFSNYFDSATRFYSTTVVDRNEIRNCNQGIGGSSAASTTVVPACGNVFDTVASRVGAGTIGGQIAIWVAERIGLKLLVPVAAIPTTGTWEKGDRFVNQAGTVGQPKAWQCTVAGSPGTLTSEGNL